MRKLALILLIPFCVMSQPSTTKVLGYLPTWWYGNVGATNNTWSNFTHVTLFPALDASADYPYCRFTGVDDGNWFAKYRDSIHAAGAKVLFSATGGYGQTNMPVVAADEAKCQAFVDTACGWAKVKGLDGIELDWEFPRAADKVGWNKLIGKFRKKLDTWSPKGILACSMFYGIGGPDDGPYQLDSMVAAMDIIMPMTYTMWMGTSVSPYYSGFDTPVHSPGTTYGDPYHGFAIDKTGSGGPNTFPAAGYPKSKLCMAISFEGTRFGGVTAINQQYSSYLFVSSVTNSASPGGYLSIPASGRVWDDVAKANYAYSGGYIWSFQDTNSVKAIIKYAQDSSWGGIMIYDFPAGYDTVYGDVLMDIVYREALQGTGGETPPATIRRLRRK